MTIEWNKLHRYNADILIWSRGQCQKKGIHIYRYNQIDHTILEIEFLWQYLKNQVNRHFKDLKYLFTVIIQYVELLSRITERGRQKLYALVVMDVKFGSSAFDHFITFHNYFALLKKRICHIFLQEQISGVEWLVILEDLQINHFNQIRSILLIIVDKDSQNA